MDRAAVKERARQSIDTVFDAIKKLESKKENISTEAAVKVNREIEALKGKKRELEERYKALETVSKEKWGQAKEDFTASLESFKKGVDKLAQILR